MKLSKLITACVFGGGILAACEPTPETQAPSSSTVETKIATVHDATARANAKVKNLLDFSDRRDFERADRGFTATFEDTLITSENGAPAYDPGANGFLEGDAFDSVNPSLWG